MNNNKIIRDITLIVEQAFNADATGHDWWHIARVVEMADKIAIKEKADRFVVKLAALLHDMDDWKLHSTEKNRAKTILEEHAVKATIVQEVLAIIETVSFKGAGVETMPSTLEGKIVQDADRLDAIGAIGIARTFAYGGAKGRAMYTPDSQPDLHHSFEAYKKSEGATINHFYEKLLLLKDRMHTETAKQLAQERHRYMEQFLVQFYNEWNGKR